MLNRTELIQAVDLICKDIANLIETITNNKLDEICFQHNNAAEFLTPFEITAIYGLIVDRYKLDIEDLINSEVIYLPLKFMAVYVLLNSEG